MGNLNTSEKHFRRRSIRLPEFDYRNGGYYFVNVCVNYREAIFGSILDEKIALSRCGYAIRHCMRRFQRHNSLARLDAYIVMPDHVHFIVRLFCVEAQHAAPLQRQRRFGDMPSGSLSTIVRSIKSASTRGINILRGTPGMPVWQRNYHERIIRSEYELSVYRRYIRNNPRSYHRHD